MLDKSTKFGTSIRVCTAYRLFELISTANNYAVHDGEKNPASRKTSEEESKLEKILVACIKNGQMSNFTVI